MFGATFGNITRTFLQHPRQFWELSKEPIFICRVDIDCFTLNTPTKLEGPIHKMTIHNGSRGSRVTIGCASFHIHLGIEGSSFESWH